MGHSFTADDKELVAKFTTYFSQLAQVLPHFSWQHAEDAEPELLAAKVLRIIADKNTFIAIYTKKERVVQDINLKSHRFSARLRAKRDKFEWKTSDWIIQEIGLATGLGLFIILLLENGMRRPGGLQGDVEHISFDRSAPEQSFGKILEMLKALTPKQQIATLAATGADPTKPDPETSTPLVSADDKTQWLTPKPEWGRQQYEVAYVHTLVTETEDDAKVINDSYIATTGASLDDNKASWEAYKEFIHLIFGKGGSLARLKQLVVEHPTSGDVLSYLARGYAQYGEHENAALTYIAAAQIASEDKSRVLRLARAAISYSRTGNGVATDKLVQQINTKVMTPALEKEVDTKLEILGYLRQIAEIRKEDEIWIGLSEYMLSIAADDIGIRFALAYKYSQHPENELALYHYLKYHRRIAAAWHGTISA